jgi:hypothetical protein
VADNLLEAEDLVSLENGCACCSLRKDVVKAFAEIERRSRQRQRKVDTILMETTGLADPAPVAFTFFANPWVASRFKLDSIMWVYVGRDGSFAARPVARPPSPTAPPARSVLAGAWWTPATSCRCARGAAGRGRALGARGVGSLAPG